MTLNDVQIIHFKLCKIKGPNPGCNIKLIGIWTNFIPSFVWNQTYFHNFNNHLRMHVKTRELTYSAWIACNPNHKHWISQILLVCFQWNITSKWHPSKIPSDPEPCHLLTDIIRKTLQKSHHLVLEQLLKNSLILEPTSTTLVIPWQQNTMDYLLNYNRWVFSVFCFVLMFCFFDAFLLLELCVR